MTKLVADFKYGTLSAGIGSTDTTITSAEFADLPVVSSPDTMDLVLNPGEVGGDAEIVTVTAHTSSSTSVTVSSRSGSAHGSGTQWVHAVTAADFNRMGFDGTLEGNASTATALETARTVGGVSFDGTANINLPGVNTAGNQNTSGNAATATLAADSSLLGGLGLSAGSSPPSGSQVIKSHTNGYTYLGWINTVSGSTTSTVTRIYASNDQFVRYVTPATFRSQVTDPHYLPLSGGTMTGELQLNARLDVGNGSGGDHEIRIYKADNNVSDHIQFYNGTTRVGEIGCEDTTWLRINQETAKDIYTPRMIRADTGFQANNGSTSSPSYRFANDTNTGMYRYGSDGIGFSSAGGLKVLIDNGGSYGRLFGPGFRTGSAIIRGEASAAVPTYTFYSDENTGMYRVGADRLGFSTGAAARMYIQNSSTGLTGSSSRSLSVKAAGAVEMYRTSTGANDGILALYSNNGSTADLQWLVYGDGDTASDTGVYGTISDNRLKTNIVAYKDPTDDLMAINVIKYDLSKTSTGIDDNGDPIIVDRDHATTMTGWDAQQVQGVKPGFVKLDAERGILSVKSSVFVPLLHRGFQVHEDKLTALEARVAALEAG